MVGEKPYLFASRTNFVLADLIKQSLPEPEPSRFSGGELVLAGLVFSALIVAAIVLLVKSKSIKKKV